MAQSSSLPLSTVKNPSTVEEGSLAAHQTVNNSAIGEREEEEKDHRQSSNNDGSADQPLAHSIPPWQIHLIFASLSVAGFLANLDQNIVSTSMPTIASEFNSLTSQSWILTSYLITSTVFQPVFGRATDLFGSKRSLLVSIGIFEFGSVLTATAQNFVWLCCGRAVAGIGAAGLQVVILIMITKLVPLRERGKYMGVVFARFAVASAIGPVLGGIFSTSATWRWCFYINLPLGGISTLIVLSLFSKIPDYKLEHVKITDIDIGGLGILIIAVVSLLLGLSWGGITYAWNSPQVISLIALGGVLIPLFIVYELNVPKIPVIPMSIFKYRNVVGATVNYFFINWGVYALSAYLPTYYQLVKGDKQLISGLELLAYVMPILLSTFCVGLLISRTGWVRPFLWGGGLINLIGTACCVLFNSTTCKGAEFGILAITGLGIGFVFQTNTLVGQSQVKQSELASAATMTTWSKTLGGIIGLTAEGVLIQNVVSKKIRGNPISAPYVSVVQSTSLIHQAPQEVQNIIADAYGSAFSNMMVMAAAFTAVGFLGSLMVERIVFSKKTRGSGHPAEEEKKIEP